VEGNGVFSSCDYDYEFGLNISAEPDGITVNNGNASFEVSKRLSL
jgi:hypothetical protein